jgi:hypothetical protein
MMPLIGVLIEVQINFEHNKTSAASRLFYCAGMSGVGFVTQPL